MTTIYNKTETADDIIKRFFETEGSRHCSTLIGNMTPLDVARRAWLLGLKSSKESKAKSRKASILIKNPQLQTDFKILSDLTNPRSVYILGLLWADGNVSKNRNRITISTTEPDLESISSAVSEVKSWKIYHKRKAKKKPHWKEQYHINISNPLYKDFLIEHNYANKSGESASQILQKIPEEYRKYWFLGYFDGDGSISKDGSIVDLASCYEQNWDFMERLCKQLGMEFKIERKIAKDGKKSIFRLISYVNALNFCRYIYSGYNLGFPRKRERFLKMQEYLNSSEVNWNLFNEGNTEKIQEMLRSDR